MRYTKLCCAVAVLLFSSWLHAGQEEFDDCMLAHLKDSKHDIATHLIRQACYENYKNPSFTSDKRKAYNTCLLKHLVGVESFEAVMEINAACSRKYR